MPLIGERSVDLSLIVICKRPLKYFAVWVKFPLTSRGNEAHAKDIIKALTAAIHWLPTGTNLGWGSLI